MSTAAGPAPAPAGLLRRYLARSLDMVVPLAVAGALCATRIAAAAARVSAALDALAQRMAQAALDALVHGAGPLALARDWLGDPAWREIVADLLRLHVGGFEQRDRVGARHATDRER